MTNLKAATYTKHDPETKRILIEAVDALARSIPNVLKEAIERRYYEESISYFRSCLERRRVEVDYVFIVRLRNTLHRFNRFPCGQIDSAWLHRCVLLDQLNSHIEWLKS